MYHIDVSINFYLIQNIVDYELFVIFINFKDNEKCLTPKILRFQNEIKTKKIGCGQHMTL